MRRREPEDLRLEANPVTNHRSLNSYLTYVTLRSTRGEHSAKLRKNLGVTLLFSALLLLFQLRCPEIVPTSASTMGRIFFTMMSTPSAVGWIPSAWLSLASAATPSRKNG
jgi:hypothetical protein